MDELASPKVIIRISIIHKQDYNRTFDALHFHQQERRKLHRNQGPSKASLQVTNDPPGAYRLSRQLKSSKNNDHEKRKLITQHLALLIHAHQCISKDKGSMKNCGTFQTAVSPLFQLPPSKMIISFMFL